MKRYSVRPRQKPKLLTLSDVSVHFLVHGGDLADGRSGERYMLFASFRYGPGATTSA